MSKKSVVALPQEVQQIAQNVTPEKRNEVQVVLNQVFDGVSKMREQLDTITIKNEADSANMKLAGNIRLSVKRVRLDAEKVFDAKREEVQQKMLGFKTEDQLWLKAKQTMQILTKEIEENAKWKEETKKRHEAEQKELRTQRREQLLSKIESDLPRSDFEDMSDAAFNALFSGLADQYNNRVAEALRQEQERIEREKAEEEERARLKQESERLMQEAKELEQKVKDAEAERIKILNQTAEAQMMTANADKLTTDKELLKRVAFVFESIPMPDVKSAEAADLVRKVKILQGKLVDFINSNLSNL